ncbi:MAG: VCBS repeat-containing protein [Candidatus Kerfeldbacteria bacterium]|nr:VCBS repeat-containing protein [Candidatus Kerfeldbacteria bacterium]
MNGPKKLTNVEVEVRSSTKIAHAISVGIYLISAIALVSIIGGIVLQLAFPGEIEVTAAPDPTNSVALVWTAPGDDGLTGTAASYTLRYATESITEATWSSATAVANVPTPLPAGTTQSTIATGLNPGATYYFALKSKDEAGNESALSNVASKRTELKSCLPDWSCTEWSVCRDGLQTRSCVDTAVPSCNSNFNRPIEEQACTTPEPKPTSCTERWSCSEWTDCVDGTRTRACTDLERCGTATNKPATSLDCSSGGPLPENPTPTYLATVPARSGRPQVKVYNAVTGKKVGDFLAYRQSYRGGLSIAGGDVDHDGTPEVLTGTGLGSAPQVSMFNLSGRAQLRFYPYTSKLKTGVNVGVADVDGNGTADLVTAPAQSFSSLVRVFTYDQSNKRFRRLAEFTAHGSRFRGGVNLAVGDIDRNGLAEVVVAPATKGRGSTVEIYEYDLSKNRMVKRHAFSAYDKKFNGGIEAAVSDVNGDGNAELVTAPAPGVTDVRVFTYVNHSTKRLGKFLAGSSRFRGGADLAGVDVDLDGKDEVVTATFSEGLPGLRVFTRNPVNGKFARLTVPYPTYIFSIRFLKGIRVTSF